VLRAYLEGSGLDIEVYEPDGAPGRASLVARIEGSDPAAPTLCLMGHTDVVPVTAANWTRDPFGGELVNGEVWGRRDRHAEPHGLSGRCPQGAGPTRLAPARHAGLSGVRRREGRRHAWRRSRVQASLGFAARRLSADRERRHRQLARRRAERHRARRREGRGVAPAAREGHARPRLDALRLGQRAGQGRSRGLAAGRLPTGAVRGRPLARLRRLARPRPGREGGARRSLPRRRDDRATACGAGPLRCRG